MSSVLVDWQGRAENAEAALLETTTKLDDLLRSIWELLRALEAGDTEQEARARRRLGELILDM